MPEEKAQDPDPGQTPSTSHVDWADLRAQADKLGISLSEVQRRERERQAKLARKNRGSTPVSR